MRFRDKAFAKGLAVGLVVGLLMTVALSATASTGKKAWDRFGDMFKAGYVAGFLDCVRIAKGFNDKGYLATAYVLPPRTKGANWVWTIDRLYQDERYQNRQLPQIMVLAGEELAKKFGPEIKTSHTGMAGLRAFLAARRKSLAEARKAKLEGEGDGSGANGADQAKADKPKKGPRSKISGKSAPVPVPVPAPAPAEQ